MTTYLGKSCSFGLPRVLFVNCRQFMYLVISLLVLRAGCGIWLYQFLIIAYLFTFNSNFQSPKNKGSWKKTKRPIVLALKPGVCRKCSQKQVIWAASSEFGTYRLCEQRRFRRACASAQSRQNLRCSLIQAESQEEPSDRNPDPWPLWMAGHAQLKFVMTECSTTQIRLTRPIWWSDIW